MAVKWQYHILTIQSEKFDVPTPEQLADIDAQFNALGDEGWEFFQVERSEHYIWAMAKKKGPEPEPVQLPAKEIEAVENPRMSRKPRTKPQAKSVKLTKSTKTTAQVRRKR